MSVAKSLDAQGTLLVSAGREIERSGVPVNPPVFRASTFLFDTLGDFERASLTPFDGPFYGRVGTPTTFAFERAFAALEGGFRSIAVSSGLAAIAATFLAFLDRGDHVLVVDSVYDPVRRLCNRTLSRLGIETTFYDPSLGADLSDLCRDNTRLIYMESPGSGTFEIQDVPAILEVAKARGIKTAIDNTWATPLFFRPMGLGVDVSIQAATKYIAGHSDAMLGVVTANETSYDAVRRSAQDMGTCAGSEECNLGLRGLRTLGVRLKQHQASALQVARWLAEREEVVRVLYPALPGFPGHDLWKRDFAGASGLFSFELAETAGSALHAFVDGLALFKIGFSWGGYESLILPSHPEKSRTAPTWTGRGPVLRLHIGLETVDHLIGDLDSAFGRMAAA